MLGTPGNYPRKMEFLDVEVLKLHSFVERLLAKVDQKCPIPEAISK